ncbi:MAG: nucleotidyltransferase family protein [Pseudomonadota bacterium]
MFERSQPSHAPVLKTILENDPARREALKVLADLNLPDCWIAAGFVRDATWDHLHGRKPALPNGDVDVVWFSEAALSEQTDRQIEAELARQIPNLEWSVKDQARMHLRNGDRPYTSVADAMQHWPETATTVGARLDSDGTIEINAPLGLNDLFALRLRPTPAFRSEKHSIFLERASTKRWLDRYPLLDFSP